MRLDVPLGRSGQEPGQCSCGRTATRTAGRSQPELQAEHERIVRELQERLDGTREDLRSAIRVLLKRSPGDGWVRMNHPTLYAELGGDAEWSA